MAPVVFMFVWDGACSRLFSVGQQCFSLTTNQPTVHSAAIKVMEMVLDWFGFNVSAWFGLV
jgi:hypothetical protein